MAAIDTALAAMLSTLSLWVLKFNGLMTDNSGSPSLLQYVVNVTTALSGLSLLAALVVMLIRPSFGSSGSGGWSYTGPRRQREGRMYRSPHYGPNLPAFGTKKDPLPFQKRKRKFPWNITGLNVDGRATWKTKAWKPTNLVMSMLRNGVVPGLVGWIKTKQGVKSTGSASAAGVSSDKGDSGISDAPKEKEDKEKESTPESEPALDAATEAALDAAIASHESGGGGG